MEEAKNQFYAFICKAVNRPVVLYDPKSIVIKVLFIEASTVSCK